MPSVLNVIYEVITPIFVISMLGVLFGRRANADPRTLSRAAVYLFLPCLILSSISGLEMDVAELGKLVLLVACLVVIVTTLGWGLARLQSGLGQFTQSAFILCVVLINSGNYGLPLIEFAYGKAGLQRAIVVMIMMSIITNTLGVFLASRGAASIRESALNVFKVPLPYAVALGFLLKLGNIPLPVALERSISLLGQAAIPVLLVLLGMQLSHFSLRSEAPARLRAVLLVSAVRLLISPLLVLLLTQLLGITGLTRQVVVVQLSMPTAVNASLLATEFHSDARFATAAVLVSTLASIATLSILLALMGGPA